MERLMTNPIKAITDYLRGEDLKVAPPTEQKLYYQQDIGAAIMMGTLVHGPGATDLINGVYSSDGNSAVFSCLNAIATAFPEAPMRMYRAADDPGSRDLIPDHSMQGLLDRPNPFMSPQVLWYWIQWAKHCDGNAYVRKLRNGNPDTGNVVQLWPISPRLIEPKTVKGSGEFISFYRYHYDPGHWEDIPPHNMIHFRLGINDADHRLGLAPLKRLVQEVATDQEATRFSDALLRNYGIPGLVVQVPEGNSMNADQARDLKQSIIAGFGNDNRGNVGVLTQGATMSQFGFSPEVLNLTAIHRLPEERISAVLRVPAIIAGLGAGLDRATYANFKEAREMFTESTILPLYQFDAGTINSQLKPDFTNDPRVYAAFDITDLRALQEDENAKYTRLNIGVTGGWIDPDEARADVGLPPRGVQPTAIQPGKSLFMAMKAAGQFDDYPALMDAMVELARPELEADLNTYFDEQRKRIKRRVMEA
jgi:HK97 family phage portal protein